MAWECALEGVPLTDFGGGYGLSKACASLAGNSVEFGMTQVPHKSHILLADIGTGKCGGLRRTLLPDPFMESQ